MSMSESEESIKEQEKKEYIKYVKERLKRVDYRAEEKLKRIDELADVIFSARKNYRKKS